MAYLVVCRVLCVEVVGATSSAGFLVVQILVSSPKNVEITEVFPKKNFSYLSDRSGIITLSLHLCCLKIVTKIIFGCLFNRVSYQVRS